MPQAPSSAIERNSQNGRLVDQTAIIITVWDLSTDHVNIYYTIHMSTQVI